MKTYMNYYALPLEDGSYTEKCLCLLRLINKPESRSIPHITIRLIKITDKRTEELEGRTFSYLDIIEPGYYNLDEQKPPYVVFLKCESEELEELEYKPDFPYSRLHLTIYDGTDYGYAMELYRLLCTGRWHFKLVFDRPRQLMVQKIGSMSAHRSDTEAVCKEIIGKDFKDILHLQNDATEKLDLTKKVMEKLERYLNTYGSNNISSGYADPSEFDSYMTGRRYDLWDNGNDGILPAPEQTVAYITPPEYAQDMAACGLKVLPNNCREIDFGDSAVGTGNLFLALKSLMVEENNRGYQYEIRSAVGIDTDPKMVLEAYTRCHTRGLDVIQGDALFLDDLELGPKRNLMLVNPPFCRHEEIPDNYKKAAAETVKSGTGIDISKKAGLYAYHLLAMDRWLDQSGVGVWLLPAVFMQTRYAGCVRRYLMEKVHLLRVHVYDEKEEQFCGRMISTAIVVFRKENVYDNEPVLFSFGVSTEMPSWKKLIKKSEILSCMENWRVLLCSKREKKGCIRGNDEGMDVFGDLFEIKRGIATGANSFFTMSREKAGICGIPDCALRPLLPKSRYLDSPIIEADRDGYPNVRPQLVLIDCCMEEKEIEETYPDFYHYLKKAESVAEDGTRLMDRTLIRQRSPWYRQEQRDPAPFLLTYMGRGGPNKVPLHFLWNKSQAVALNTYILLYPKDSL